MIVYYYTEINGVSVKYMIDGIFGVRIVSMAGDPNGLLDIEDIENVLIRIIEKQIEKELKNEPRY